VLTADEVPESIRRLIAILADSVPGFDADFKVKRADPHSRSQTTH